ncbi:MAG: hypothetical protein JST54_28990 [Deltaproteobacteria bacterium]|nr:hypothetical protein [Deltaproteobacteria bacterium]
MTQMSNRLALLEKAVPKPRVDTPEARRAYCRDNGLPEDWVVLGLGSKMVIVLPPLDGPPR